MTRSGVYFLSFFFVLLAETGGGAVFAAISIDPNVGVQGEQYAPDLGPSTRIDLKVGARSDEDGTEDAPRLPAKELHFYSFFETGPLGDRSVDVDSTVARIGLGDSAHIWIGRTHPLAEGWSGLAIHSTDAIGANWAQDQSDALQPRVSGWIGAGFHYRDPSTGLAATAGYSPIFLPSFGPRLDLSATSSASGSRFSRLPPEYVSVNGNLYPLFYKLDAGNLWNIVHQDQVFAAIGREVEGFDVHAMFWTAPDPSVQPQIDPNHPVEINGGAIDVPVSVHPSFPQQHFWGLQATASGILFKPALMGVYQAENQSLTLSAELAPLPYLRAGYLNTFGSAGSVGGGDVPGVVSPAYADQLVWFEASTSLFHGTITPSLRWEQSLDSANQGFWIRPRVDYRIDRSVSLFAYASLLDGVNYSYFGTWRSLDSAGMGANWTW